MVRAIIFDCYGVLTINGAPWLKTRSNQPLLGLIGELKKTYKIGMLSNAVNNRLDEFLTSQEIELFDCVALSGEVGVGKPDPEAYAVVADRLGVDVSECLFVDDLPDFCEVARTVGMQSICYRDFDQFQRELGQIA